MASSMKPKTTVKAALKKDPKNKGLKADLAGMKKKPTSKSVARGKAAGEAMGKGIAKVISTNSANPAGMRKKVE